MSSALLLIASTLTCNGLCNGYLTVTTEKLFSDGFNSDEYSEPDNIYSSGNDTDVSIGNEGDDDDCDGDDDDDDDDDDDAGCFEA